MTLKISAKQLVDEAEAEIRTLSVEEAHGMLSYADVHFVDADAIVAAGQDDKAQRDLVESVQRNFDERGIFGVPTLIMPRGTRYWGHDRIEWAIREGLVPGAAA